MPVRDSDHDKSERVLRPHDIQAISAKLGIGRKDLLDRFEKAVGATTNFAVSASQAIGDISVEEATQGIIDCFRDEMRK